MDAGLGGDELLLDAGQEPLAFGQGQAEAGQVGEVAGPGDPQDIGAVLLSLSSEAHQSHDPGHVAPTSTRRTGPRIPPSALAPPISRQSQRADDTAGPPAGGGGGLRRAARPAARAGRAVAGADRERGRALAGGAAPGT